MILKPLAKELKDHSTLAHHVSSSTYTQAWKNKYDFLSIMKNLR